MPVVFRVRVGYGHTLLGTIALDEQDTLVYEGDTPEHEQALRASVQHRDADQRDWTEAAVVRALPERFDNYSWAVEVEA